MRKYLPGATRKCSWSYTAQSRMGSELQAGGWQRVLWAGKGADHSSLPGGLTLGWFKDLVSKGCEGPAHWL